MKFQYDELKEAQLKEGEIEQLEIDIKRIQNSENLSLALNAAYVTLTDEHAITDRLYTLSSELQNVNQILPETFEKLKEEVDQFYYTLEDAKHQIYEEINQTEFDEQYLNELESRMNLLNNLKRKYGKDISDLMIYQEKSLMKLIKSKIMKKVPRNYVKKSNNYRNKFRKMGKS